jgi:NAD(P)-dependent dehydrogenase (short-subunit alcohol dehydrogenase family)
MNRVAIVTGGSRGIGREAAEHLARAGYAVVANNAGNRTEADAAVEAIREPAARRSRCRATLPTRRPWPRCSTRPKPSSAG